MFYYMQATGATLRVLDPHQYVNSLVMYNQLRHRKDLPMPILVHINYHGKGKHIQIHTNTCFPLHRLQKVQGSQTCNPVTTLYAMSKTCADVAENKAPRMLAVLRHFLEGDSAELMSQSEGN